VRRPQVKGIHKPVRLTPTLINLGGRQMGIGAELDDEDGTLWRLLGLMDGTRTREEIVAAVIAERPDMPEDEAAEAMQAIIDAGYVEDAGEVVRHSDLDCVAYTGSRVGVQVSRTL